MKIRTTENSKLILWNAITPIFEEMPLFVQDDNKILLLVASWCVRKDYKLKLLIMKIDVGQDNKLYDGA